MILQRLQFPNFDTCSCYEMYFRTVESPQYVAPDSPPPLSRLEEYIPQRAYYDAGEKAVHAASWQHLGFDTYFNDFSIGKWRMYTCLDNLKLHLELKGSFVVRLMHKYIMNTEYFSNTFAEQVCRCDERQAFEFVIPCDAWDRGMVCFSLEALECADNVCYGGWYETDVDEEKLNPVNIAIDICTFRRESFVERNVALLKRELIENPDSPVCGHLDVFISDNGQTLDAKKLMSDRVHVFPNKNVGGAGGFTRGMIEVMNMRPKRSFSHVLVMDDDVLINPDALVRTYRLLQFLKPEHAGKTIAGAMLRLDNRSIQHECGGWWDGNYVHACKMHLELTKLEYVLRNDTQDSPNYNAWWYSCIPMSKINDANLPLPIFIRYDDVEFGLRTGSDILSLNGICLWHEPFEYKYSASMEYYHMRNALIVNAFHRPGYDAKAAIGHLRQMVKGNLGRYRYDNCDLVFRGVEDFCKGPEFLLNTDGEALHKEIMAAAVKMQPLQALPVQFDEGVYLRSMKKERIRWKLVRYLTLNKHLLPRRGTGVVDASLNGTKDFAGKHRVLNYDVAGGRGFVTEYNGAKVREVMRKMRKAEKLLKQKHAEACEAYRQAQGTLTSREFWDRYLGL